MNFVVLGCECGAQVAEREVTHSSADVPHAILSRGHE